MKASVKIRDGEAPLLRAKLPLSLVGLPALSKLSLAPPHDLALHLCTLFDAGPSCRISYTPNHLSPFSFTLKTGFGLWGSPHGAALLMTAQFKLSSPTSTSSPSFFLRFKPRAGDFCLHKEARSHDFGMENGRKLVGCLSEDQEFMVSKDDGNHGFELKDADDGGPRVRVLDRAKALDAEAEAVFGSSYPARVEGKGKDKQGMKGGGGSGRRESIKDYVSEKGSDDGCVVLAVPEDQRQEEFVSQKQGLSSSLRGWSLVAHSSLPIGKKAVATIRWRLGLSANIPKSFTKIKDGFSLMGLPLLVMDKVSLEAVQPFKKGVWGHSSDQGMGLPRASQEMEELGRVAALCGLMRRQMHLIQAENEVLKNTMEDMRAEMEYKGGFSRCLQGEKLNDFLNQEKELLQAKNFDQQQSKRNVFAASMPNDRKVAQVIESRARARGDQSKQDSVIDIKREAPSSVKGANDKATGGSS